MQTLLRSHEASVEIIYTALFVSHGKVEVVVSLMVLTHFEVTLSRIPVIFGESF